MVDISWNGFMGIIDSNKFRIECSECEVAERVTIHEKGSVFGSKWNAPPRLEKFTAEWKEEGMGPAIVSAKCIKCGNSARIESLS